MSSRSYLSIGDVLTLLREEFPDVTISKIRFLESQGLVNPERSPSGYRKFFEHDVERLRWVLRQQREHFLPLKVIRDRLDAGDLSEGDEASEAGVVRGNGVVSPPAHAAAGVNGGVAARSRARGGTAGVGRGDASSQAAPGRAEAQAVQADNEAMARILADASRRTAMIPESGERGPLHVVPDPPAVAADVSGPPTAPPPDHSGAAPSRHRDVEPRHAAEAPVPVAKAPSARDLESPAPKSPARAAAGGGVGAGSPPPAKAEPPARTGPGPGRSTPAGGRPGGLGAGGPGAGGPGAGGSGSSSMVTGASLTAEELCAATGLSDAELSGLQGFGLMEPVMVAGIPTFDEDALTVANLAADFRKFGIEARHLRLYRNAVDREVGLIEQVIIPLLRQRNPESRQKALDAAEELGTLGQTMRATLLRSALRRHVGG